MMLGEEDGRSLLSVPLCGTNESAFPDKNTHAIECADKLLASSEKKFIGLYVCFQSVISITSMKNKMMILTEGLDENEFKKQSSRCQ